VKVNGKATHISESRRALTALSPDGRFASTRDDPGETALSRTGKPLEVGDLSRRDFLIRLCEASAATFVPSRIWKSSFLSSSDGTTGATTDGADFFVRPRYPSEWPLDAMLLNVNAGSDRFLNEKWAEEIAAILTEWSEALLRSPRDTKAIDHALATNCRAAPLEPIDSRVTRSSPALQVRQNKFSDQFTLDREEFLRQWRSAFEAFSEVQVAEFQVTSIHAEATNDSTLKPRNLLTEVRYEIAGTGSGFHREQRIGVWEITWEYTASGPFRLQRLQTKQETVARSTEPFYVDISAAALGRNPSYSAQMLRGTDYWRTVLDGASGIDIYGHNGVSVADIYGDGLDDLYVCQPAGLPNRLYRNRGDGTFEDVTQNSGLGILENTTCALFADFNNDGRQEVVLVRANGPLFYVNEGGGRFRAKPEAFQFATPSRGTFTGAAVADYDRDGWLDIYFCLYSYYQGAGQYRYPSPYHDAENGPPNFLMRNNRDGTFRDVTAQSGLNQNNTRYSFCCAWDDYNRDGWPDLYVVNDFGRKNLYRNNGNGTFTDVAQSGKAEDLGAGMSVSWLDYDNDGADDLYVANMWTAAGLRVSTDNAFRKESPADVQAAYRKHAMGNSLLRNQGSAFTEQTSSSGASIGRWAWSSDAFDFDHDGFPDLYVVNGMVSGPSRLDLNSFFWRQVVANSPDKAAASREYEQGWAAVNELIRSDGTWSGYERNNFYANHCDGTFSDVSAVVGLDFLEDGRSFAVADFDQDGRLEIALKNRSAPQLRIVKNVVQQLAPSVAFRLQGAKSNRDAVGARITLESGGKRQTQTLRVGSGFLSQHSKQIFFGLGDWQEPIQATISWPNGFVQELRNIPVNHRIWVEEGSEASRIEPFKHVQPLAYTERMGPESLPSQIETWLLAPIVAPEFSLPDLSGKNRTPSDFRGKPGLLHFWTSKSNNCIAQLREFDKSYVRWSARGLHLLSINVDDWAELADRTHPMKRQDSAALNTELSSFPVLRGSDDVVGVYNILFRQIYDRHRDMPLPTTFLIDEGGKIVKLYVGAIAAEHIEGDLGKIPKSDAERLARGLPFQGSESSYSFGRNFLSLGTLFFQRGYLDQAALSFEQALQDDPSSAEALYGIGSVYLNQNKNAAAREMFERSIKAQAGYPDTLPDAWNNLGVIATRENRVSDAAADFQQALALNPNHLLSLNNLSNAYRLQKRWEDARQVLEHALAIAPDDPEANYSLGMVYAQTDDTAKAYEHLQQALKVRPNYPEALNNLGVLYLVTKRIDQAVASFQECIRVAPSFDQAYLNLARVYVLRGERDKARGLLGELLKQVPEQPQAKQMMQQLQP
jgi:tetratricopeptide (TPR) repeat protein